MKKVALHGSYFGDNFGDTLFVIEYINWLKDLNDYNAQNIMLPFAGNRVRDLVKVSDKKGVKSILSAEALVFIGGGYLGEPPTGQRIWSYRFIVRHLSVILLAYLFKKPYIFVGVGAGPLSHKIARKLSVFLLNHSEKIIVRDEESHNYLLEYGVNSDKLMTTADSILSLEPTDVNQQAKNEVIVKNQLNNKKETLIGVHLPVPSTYKNSLSSIIKDIKKYTENLNSFKIVVFKDFYKEDYDYLAYSKIKEHFNKEDITYIKYENPDQLIALIDTLDIVVTTKLHCGIVANCLGKFTLSISAHTKTKRLYKQLGLLERNVSIANYESGKLIEMLNKYDDKKEFYNNIPYNIKETSKKNKEELLEFIKE